MTMKYLKNPGTQEIVSGHQDGFGSFFDSWVELSQDEIDAYELEQVKQTKIAQLKLERDRLTSGAKTHTITVSGISCSFALSNADLPNLMARQFSLTSESDTNGWNDISGKRIELNKVAFLGLVRHINVNDVDTWALYTEKLAEINACTALEDLNNININF